MNDIKDNYVPFGPEWEKALQQLTKKELIPLIKKAVLQGEAAVKGLDNTQPVVNAALRLHLIHKEGGSAAEWTNAWNKLEHALNSMKVIKMPDIE